MWKGYVGRVAGGCCGIWLGRPSPWAGGGVGCSFGFIPGDVAGNARGFGHPGDASSFLIAVDADAMDAPTCSLLPSSGVPSGAPFLRAEACAPDAA